MTVLNPLSVQSEVVDERRRWSQDWYTWLSDLVADVLGIADDVTAIQGDITTIQGDVTTIQGDITTIQGDITALQSGLSGPSDQIGFADGSDAPTGDVGEYLSSFVLSGSAVGLTTNTDAQITSLLLSEGDWDLSGEFFAQPSGGATITDVRAAISVAVASLPTVPTDGTDLGRVMGISTTLLCAVSGLRTRVNITTPTTYILTGRSAFTGGTVGGYGALRARRMR